MAQAETVARALASAVVAGPWQVDELIERGRDVLGRRWRWLPPLAQRLTGGLRTRSRPARGSVLQFLLEDAGFQRACHKHDLRLHGLQQKRPEMVPAAGRPASWEVPSLVTPGELADWLKLRPEELDWFADRRHLERSLPPGRLRHYRYYWLSKRLGGSARLIEAPKWRLKTIQRRVLHGILDNIPSHPAAHGFRMGRSIHSFVSPHAGQAIVLRTDLKDFFPSVPRGRVAAVFRTAGYPEEAAQVLASLCTNQVPEDVWRHFPQYGGIQDRFRHEGLYCRPHLPQGAPTSPALANLCAFRLDCRLDALARSAGGQYTRYADDLLFSGPQALAASIRRFYLVVRSIAIEEGFEVNARKTRIMRQGSRQCAAGLVLNEHANIPRERFDRLKAVLHNCVRQGPAGQNRWGLPALRSHLEGRVGFVESVNPDRGKRLRALFDRIDWE